MKRCRAQPPARRAGSRGVTLVELMISVTLGLLIVVILAQLFLGSRQTFATTDDISRMQDNIRFSQQLLTRIVHLSGYKSQANSVTSTVFGAAAPLDTTLTSGDTPDTLIVRFQGSGKKKDYGGADCQAAASCDGADGSVTDCLGVKIDAGVIAVNKFSISDGANGKALFCNNKPGAEPGVEIVPGVANMQILFGEDTDGDLVANRYVPSDIAGGVKIGNVVSVRIALLFETPTESRATADPAQTYDMFGVAVGPFPDRRIRRVVTTTINVRNRTP